MRRDKALLFALLVLFVVSCVEMECRPATMYRGESNCAPAMFHFLYSLPLSLMLKPHSQ